MIQAINNIAEMLKTILNVIPQIFDYIIEGINNAISFGKSLVETVPNVKFVFNSGYINNLIAITNIIVPINIVYVPLLFIICINQFEGCTNIFSTKFINLYPLSLKTLLYLSL